MKKLHMLLGVALVGISLLTGCKGDTGPAGPAGNDGNDGAPGLNGNANVIGTNTVAVTGWAISGTSWLATVAVPDITQNVVNTGLVEVYVQYGSTWFCLPDIIGINATTFGFSVGTVNLQNSNSDNSTPAVAPNITVRVVVIPANMLAAHPGVNWKNYTAISQFMGNQ